MVAAGECSQNRRPLLRKRVKCGVSDASPCRAQARREREGGRRSSRPSPQSNSNGVSFVILPHKINASFSFSRPSAPRPPSLPPSLEALTVVVTATERQKARNSQTALTRVTDSGGDGRAKKQSFFVPFLGIDYCSFFASPLT